MKEKKGFILISAVFFMTLAIIMSAFVVNLILNELTMARDGELALKAFWAAEGGVEWGKAKLSENPSWYTDPPHSPGDDELWLTSGASGYHVTIGDVHVKIVREEGKKVLYAVGYVGDNIERAKALSLIKIRFNVSPFEQLSWTMI